LETHVKPYNYKFCIVNREDGSCFVLRSTYVLFSSSTYSLKYAKIQLMQYLDNTLLNKIQIMDVIY